MFQLSRPATSAFLAVSITWIILTMSCVRDPQVPWDTEQMARELTAELRRFQGLSADLEEHHVVAWRVDTLRAPPPSSRPSPDDPRPERTQVGLLWGRTRADRTPARWLLVQGFQDADGTSRWQRAVTIRELKAPLVHPRPGEDRTGTWHGVQMYDHPPTSREICDFANVEFFGSLAEAAGNVRRVAGAVRRHAWRRVTGEEPACGFAGQP